MFSTKKVVLSGLFVAMGVVLSTFYIPFGAAKCFPTQHFINVLSAVLIGPGYAVINAFLISIIRNTMGIGSLLAFPGSMIGALLAGLAYRFFKNHRLACFGEIIGTGLIGGLVASVVANLIMGKEVSAVFFIMPFMVSTLVGSVVALLLFEVPLFKALIKRYQKDEDILKRINKNNEEV